VPPFAGLRTNDALYVEYDSGERELYNLAGDPSQLENLIKRADQASVANFAGRLARLRKAGGKTGRALENAPYTLALPQAKRAAKNDKKGHDRGHRGGKQAAGKRNRGNRGQAAASGRHDRRAGRAPTPRARRHRRLRRARRR
ncbi:MAG TPA: hypothetical protein VFQ80_04435, partial [Thermomicrobiales bacterium]|nr:hypothetical protein [Thermomicrobiales bacterium]